MPKIQPTSWEEFDAEALFPPPHLHTNKIIKIDKKDLSQDDLGDTSSEPSQGEKPQDGDSVTSATPDQNHVDELFEMDSDGTSSEPDDREVNADKEEDRRTEEPEADSESSEPDKDTEGEDGADDPIQKESEDVDEVADATSKTSEDVHGGDEATKDIEDSPNAADNGQNPDNEGAEDGQDGDDGEGEGQGGEADSKTSGQTSEDPLDEKDWEQSADHSATALQLENDLQELEAKERDEGGHRTGLPSYEFDREDSPIELEIAFQKGRELIRKLAAEEDLTARTQGFQRWCAKTIAHNMVSYRHQRIPVSRYERPREADIAILLDISGSCQAQAEMFMAIAAGAIGNGVEIYVGYNGSCRASAMQVPKRLPRSYKQAKAWVQLEINRVSGWDNEQVVGEWNFEEFVEEVKPKTLIIFGDWDGIDQYQDVVHTAKFRPQTKFFWFCNEGHCDQENAMPEKWTKKNYLPGVYGPRDLVKALRKLR